MARMGGVGLRTRSLRLSSPLFLATLAFVMALFIILSMTLAHGVASRDISSASGFRPPIAREQSITGIGSSSLALLPSSDSIAVNGERSGLRIAVAVTVLDIKPDKGGWMDGCAVFAKSVQEAVKKSKYPHDLIALVKPEAVDVAQKYLTPFGFRIISSPIPIDLEEIRNVPFREEIEKSGCCGHAELIKFCAYKLTDYDFVLHMDVDTLLLGPIDELYEMNRTLLYTKDLFLMGDQYMQRDNFREYAMIQGGFVLLKPDLEVFEGLMDVVREGDFRSGTGWGGTEIGYGYGGPTFQGVLPYYFQSIRNMTHSKDYYEVDNCIYNVMNELTGRHKGDPDCVSTIKDMKIYHFTFCQKPWTCSDVDSVTHPACHYVTDEWWRYSREVEKDMNKPERHRCKGPYEPIIVVPPTPALLPSVKSTRRPSTKRPTKTPTPAPTSLTPTSPAYPDATVAVCITVLSAGDNFFDGLAVLATSVRQMALRSKYKYALIALVLPSVVEQARDMLEQSGWIVKPTEVPVKLTDIRNSHYRAELVRSGCCGEKELLKFCAYKLLEYEKVILLDTDTIFLHPIDELLSIKNNYLVFTRDYGMSGHLMQLKNWREASMIQGGFVVLTPSLEAFDGLCEQVKIGDFRPSTGWGGKNIGWGYGGPTFQGLMPYFWQEIMNISVHPVFPPPPLPQPSSSSSSVTTTTTTDNSYLLYEVQDCIYDTMREPDDRDDVEKIGKCKNTPQEVKLAHFTVCQKPWTCSHPRGPQCKYLTDMWWNISRVTEKELGLPERRRCKGGNYRQIRKQTNKEDPSVAGRRLRHSSGKCVVPQQQGEDIDDNTHLRLASGAVCDSPAAYFAIQKECLVHIDSGKCVHVFGGGDHKSRAPLVLFSQCNEQRLHFIVDPVAKTLIHNRTGYCAAVASGNEGAEVEIREECSQFELI